MVVWWLGVWICRKSTKGIRQEKILRRVVKPQVLFQLSEEDSTQATKTKQDFSELSRPKTKQLPSKTLNLNNILEVYHFDLLKQFLEEKVKKFKADSIKPCLEKWKFHYIWPRSSTKSLRHAHQCKLETYSKFSITITTKWNNFHWKRPGVLTPKDSNCPIWTRTGRICLTNICTGKTRWGLQIDFKLEEAQWESRI